MNHYPSWWNTTITLYNKFIDPTDNRVKWYRHVIPDCFYKHTVDKLNVGNVAINSTASICRIRASEDYIDKIEWKDLTDDEKSEKFTLSPGDIIVAGEIVFEIDDYTAGKRATDLTKDKSYPGGFVIETVDINTGGGRGNEHYSARGT